MAEYVFEAGASWLAEYLLSDDNMEKARDAVYNSGDVLDPSADNYTTWAEAEHYALAALHAVLGKGAVMSEATTIVCICGSTRFRDEIASARAKLTLAGEIVVGPEVLVRSDHAYADMHDTEAKVALDELHLRKIDLASYVYVVNPGGYIGKSTRREIAYAESLRKPIQFLEWPSDE